MNTMVTADNNQALYAGASLPLGELSRRATELTLRLRLLLIWLAHRRTGKHMKFSALALLATIAATGAQARSLLCVYDWMTHETLLQLTESELSQSGLECALYHRQSPHGGEELYFFETSPTMAKSCTDNITKIDNGFYYFSDIVPEIFAVNFAKPKMEALQFPVQYLMDRAPGSIVSWDCKRLD